MNPRSRKLKQFYMLLHNQGMLEYTYYENDSVTGNITTLLYIGTKNTTKVPTSIDENTVDSIGIYTFMGNTTLTSVEIPEGITSID